MGKITIAAPNAILRKKVDRFCSGHRVHSIEWNNNLAIITYVL